MRGHAPLPELPRRDVWLTMEGVGATVASGEIHKISVLDEGRAETGRGPTKYLLPVLYDKLSQHQDKTELTLWVDERIPADTVVRALYTGGRAGHTGYAFVVGKSGAREIVRVVPPKFAAAGSPKPEGPAWADLRLAWTAEGVTAHFVPRYSENAHAVLGVGSQPGHRHLPVPLDVGGGRCVLPGGARVDRVALATVLRDLCAAADGKRFALQARLGERQPFGDILWALAADSRPESCRLPTIVEAGTGAEPSCSGALSLDTALASFRKPVETSGAGFGGRGKRVPRVRQAKSKVQGALDKDIIRRIVRAHINEVRHCYEQGLKRKPDLAGRVEIRFTIGPSGAITKAKVESSTVTDAEVAKCIAKAVETWKFPKPQGGGNVNVTYPFVLSPG